MYTVTTQTDQEVDVQVVLRPRLQQLLGSFTAAKTSSVASVRSAADGIEDCASTAR
jgi:hypothetical protein